MDVELQILKHRRRDTHPTVGIIDEYCEEYRDLFKEVRNYECFKYLHLGIISTIKRKSFRGCVRFGRGDRECRLASEGEKLPKIWV